MEPDLNRVAPNVASSYLKYYSDISFERFARILVADPFRDPVPSGPINRIGPVARVMLGLEARQGLPAKGLLAVAAAISLLLRFRRLLPKRQRSLRSLRSAADADALLSAYLGMRVAFADHARAVVQIDERSLAIFGKGEQAWAEVQLEISAETTLETGLLYFLIENTTGRLLLFTALGLDRVLWDSVDEAHDANAESVPFTPEFLMWGLMGEAATVEPVCPIPLESARQFLADKEHWIASGIFPVPERDLEETPMGVGLLEEVELLMQGLERSEFIRLCAVLREYVFEHSSNDWVDAYPMLLIARRLCRQMTLPFHG